MSGGGAPLMARCAEAFSWLCPDTLSFPKVLNSCEVIAAALLPPGSLQRERWVMGGREERVAGLGDTNRGSNACELACGEASCALWATLSRQLYCTATQRLPPHRIARFHGVFKHLGCYSHTQEAASPTLPCPLSRHVPLCPSSSHRPLVISPR